MPRTPKKLSPAAPPRSPCPVANALDLIGDRWTLLVVRDLFAGKTLFREFAASPEGIATNILSSRLRQLCDAGLAERVPSKGRKGQFAYQLTARGRSLAPVLRAVADWGLTNIAGTEERVRVHPVASDA